MNWAPPTIPTHRLAERPEREITDGGRSSGEAGDERRGLGAVPAAAWVGLLGGALLLTAAVGVVAGHWSAIGQGARVAGLFAVTAGLLAVAHRLRPALPTTSEIVAHVGTFLTGTVGIALLSMFGATWPVCITVGGGILVAATGAQAGRWRATTMHLGQVAGSAMLATGIAALAGTTAGLVAMILSVALLVTGAQRRSAGLALLAVLSPALTALADAGIGAGSLERAGLVGERLSWSGPIVGLLAATVIGAVARHRRNEPMMLIAVAGPIVGIVTGLASVDGSQIAWWSLPALTVLAAELGVQLLPTNRLRTTVTDIVDVGAATVAVGLWLSPVMAYAAPSGGSTHPWAIPVTLTALAVGVSTMRWRRDDSTLADAGGAAVAAGAVAAAIALGGGAVVAAIVAIGATAGAVVLSRRLAVVAVYGSAFWALITVILVRDDVTGDAAIVIPLALLTAIAGIVIVVRARLAADGGWTGWLEMTAAATAATLAALAVTPAHGAAVALASIAAFVTAATLVEPRHRHWAIAMVAATGVMALDSATASGELDETYMWGWAAVTVAFTLLTAVRQTSLMSSAAASAATIALATTAPRLDVGAVDFTVMAMLCVVALTGVAYALERRTPLDAAALTAGFLLLCTITFRIDPLWASAAVAVVGLQVVVVGVVLRRRSIGVGGCAIAAGGVVSSWFTSRLDGWFLDTIEAVDVAVTDLWAAAMSVTALVAGLVLRRSLRINSWFAYSASLAIPGVWLVSAHVNRDPVWALPLLLTIGIASVIAGAWHRLAAPLVGGTALTLLAAVLATGSDFTAVPTWLWLALGGGVLLGTAALIERNGRPGAPDLRALMSNWG